jgi:hypothetical protein
MYSKTFARAIYIWTPNVTYYEAVYYGVSKECRRAS